MDDPATSDQVAAVRADLWRMLTEDDEGHRAYRSAVQATVVEERRATGELLDLEPLYFERRGFTRGRWLRDGEPGQYETRYGFDADGRLRTIGTWSYFTYEPGRIVERRWLGKEQPTVACVYLLDGAGRCILDVGINRRERDHFTATAYEYDGARVVRFAEYIADGPPPRSTNWYTVTWGSDGRLERIAFADAPGVSPVYQRPTRGLGPVLAEAHRLLVERIPAALTGFEPRGRVFALALGFNDSDRWELMPPTLGIRLAAQRSAYLDQPAGERHADELWNPIVTMDEPTSHDFPALDIDDEELRALGTEVAMLVHTDAHVAALIRCHVRVARELNRLDWHRILPVTDDFVVYPVDYEAGRYIDLIEAAVPAARVRRLRAAGVLPTA